MSVLQWLSLLLIGLSGASAMEWIETSVAKDPYYCCFDRFEKVIRDPKTGARTLVPYAHTPKLPDDFVGSRTLYTLLGLPFKPREFWMQSKEEQLVYLKDAVKECNLVSVVAERRGSFANCFNTCFSAGEPYPDGLEEKCEKAVWRILHKKYDISLDEFTKSLRSMIIPEEKLYSAPLIVYFADKLAPRYEFHYSGFNQDLNEVVKLPSAFEVAIGVPNEGKVVYENKG